MDPDLRRAYRFEDAMRVRCATRVERFPWGTALYNDDFPRVWDLNHLRVDRPSGMDAAGLAAEADRLLSGLTHRQAEVLDEAGAMLAPAFLDMGWWVFKSVFMALRRKPDEGAGPGLDGALVGEVMYEDIRPAEQINIRREPFGKDPETVRQLLDRTALDAGATNLRCFGAIVDGMIVSYCLLYSDGVIAQIERVGTLEEYRRRGLSRAVVQSAIDVAQAEDHDLIFLVADDDDWPKEFYGRLGFDPLGVCYSFRKVPKDERPGRYL